MDDAWERLHRVIARRRSVAQKRRHLELRARSNAVREMYHNVTESLIALYKADGGNGFNSWEHFRRAADQLTAMHKFMKLSVAKMYELGTVEGAAEYSHEFSKKIRDVHVHTSHNYVSSEHLNDYLSHSDDPPAQQLNRRKCFVTRRRRLVNPSAHWIEAPMCSSSQLSTTTTIAAASPAGCEELKDESGTLKFPTILSPCRLMELESHFSEDGSRSSGSSCGCRDCYSDTSSSSTNTDEECLWSQTTAQDKVFR